MAAELVRRGVAVIVDMNSSYDKKMEEMGGVYLKDRLGVEEWAFRRKDAMGLLEYRRSRGISCSGGDVIVESEAGKFEYTGDNWYYQRDQFHTEAEYIEGSIKKALDYINNYPEKASGQYYYVLV